MVRWDGPRKLLRHRTEVIGIIQDSIEIRDILTCLIKTDRASPGFNPALLN